MFVISFNIQVRSCSTEKWHLINSEGSEEKSGGNPRRVTSACHWMTTVRWYRNAPRHSNQQVMEVWCGLSKVKTFPFIISFLHCVSLLSQCQNRTLHKSRPAADVVAVQTARPTMQAEPSNKLPKAHRKRLTSQYLTILTCFGFDSWCSGKDCSTLCFLYFFHGACLLAEWFGR